MTSVHPSGVWVIFGALVTTIGVGLVHGIGWAVLVAGVLMMLVGVVGDFS